MPAGYVHAICNIYLDTLLHAVRFCYIYFVIYVQYVWIGKCVLCNVCNWQCMCIKIRCLTNVYVCVFFCGYISDVLRHCGSVSIKLKLTRACFKIQRLNIGRSMRWSWVTVLLTNLSECNSLWGFFRKRWAYWCIGNHTWPMYTRAWMQTLFLYMKTAMT